MGRLKNLSSGGCAVCNECTATPCIAGKPVILSGGLGCTQGYSCGMTISATNSPTSYGATGLPSGLSVNTSTGVISGTPSVSGTFNVTLSATNACGTATKAVIFVIQPSAPPPCDFLGTYSFVSAADDGECGNDTFDVTGQFPANTSVLVSWDITDAVAFVVKANGSTIYSRGCGTGTSSTTITVPAGTTTLQIIITCCAGPGGLATVALTCA